MDTPTNTVLSNPRCLRKYENMSSKDGYSWTKSQGLKAGIPCIGTVQPASNVEAADTDFDVIVVGAGYAGLTAARDTTLAGKRQILLKMPQ